MAGGAGAARHAHVVRWSRSKNCMHASMRSTNAPTHPRPPLRLVTLDLDDTLWACAPVIGRAEQRLHAWLGRHFPEVTRRYGIEELREQRMRLMEAQPALRHDLGRLRRESLRRVALDCGYAPDQLVSEAFEVFMEARHAVELYEDVRPALRDLGRRYRLAALTNGNADVRRVGLGEVFEVAVCAADVGAAKPDPAMFDCACRRVGLPPEQALHVGDDPLYDVGGARAAGLRAVWLNRDGRPWPAGHPPPDGEVSDLLALVRALRRWDSPPAPAGAAGQAEGFPAAEAGPARWDGADPPAAGRGRP